jgi:hypothetical protein
MPVALLFQIVVVEIRTLESELQVALFSRIPEHGSRIACNARIPWYMP